MKKIKQHPFLPFVATFFLLYFPNPLFAESCGPFGVHSEWGKKTIEYTRSLQEDETQELAEVNAIAQAAERCDFDARSIHTNELRKLTDRWTFTNWLIIFLRDDLKGDLLWLSFSLPQPLFMDAYKNVAMKAFQLPSFPSDEALHPDLAKKMTADLKDASEQLKKIKSSARHFKFDKKKQDPKIKNMMSASWNAVTPLAGRRSYELAEKPEAISERLNEMEDRLNQLCTITQTLAKRRTDPSIKNARDRMEKAEGEMIKKCEGREAPPQPEETPREVST